MATTVKKIKLWRGELDNRPGELARTLEPLAGTDLQIVMGYRYPGNPSKAAVELYPVSTKKSVAAAQARGITASSISALLVEGDNKTGAGHALARAISDAGINMDFLVAQAIGRRYSAVIGFESEAESSKAATVIKKASSSKRK